MSFKENGLIFDIERYATKDGPGIRTVVFFKGCNLRCDWCQNPESQSHSPQIMYYANLCRGCGRCMEACPENAIHVSGEFGLLTEHDRCTGCGLCTEVCYYNARKLLGTIYTVDEVMAEIRKDMAYYNNSGGGVTFSGGEPVIQGEFIKKMAKACSDEGIHTALETDGCWPWEKTEELLSQIDLIYYDLKHIDQEKHQEFTGVSNRLIIDNLKKLSDSSVIVIIRIPVIPGYNDSLTVQEGLYRLLLDHTRFRDVELLPYHRLGSGKYNGLGFPYKLEGVPSLRSSDIRHLVELGQDLGLSIRTGG